MLLDLHEMKMKIIRMKKIIDEIYLCGVIMKIQLMPIRQQMIVTSALTFEKVINSTEKNTAVHAINHIFKTTE